MVELQQIEVPFTGEETPTVLVALFVGYLLVPWLTSAVVKWDAPSRDKAIASIVLGAVAAAAIEISAGNPSFESVAASVFAVLSAQYTGYRQFHKPLAEGGKPTLLAIAPNSGVGRSSTPEQD